MRLRARPLAAGKERLFWEVSHPRMTWANSSDCCVWIQVCHLVAVCPGQVFLNLVPHFLHLFSVNTNPIYLPTNGED